MADKGIAQSVFGLEQPTPSAMSSRIGAGTVRAWDS